MAKRILRAFRYLDSGIVDDYLSQMLGVLTEGSITAKQVTSGGKSGGIGARLSIVEAGGKLSSTSSEEEVRTLRETPEAKFSQLYDLLASDEMIQALNGFDQEVYDSIEVGEIVEVRGQARLPEWERLTQTFSALSDLAEIMKAVGQDPMSDPNTRNAFEGFEQLASVKGQEDTALIVTPIGAPKFKFVAKLDVTFIRGSRQHLEGEVTMLGKVQRRLGQGEILDVFRMLPRLSGLETLNRAQRRAGKRSGKLSAIDSPFDEAIKYPALEIQPIAIYQ